MRFVGLPLVMAAAALMSGCAPAPDFNVSMTPGGGAYTEPVLPPAIDYAVDPVTGKVLMPLAMP